MKILFNCLTMEKGGAERVISLLANEFSKNNKVSVLTIKNSEDAYKLEPEIKRLRVDSFDYKRDNKIRKKIRKLSFARLNRLKKFIILEKPDIIISFLPEPSLRLMLLSKTSYRIRRIPKIIAIRNDPETEYKNRLVRRTVKSLYNNIDGMVFQTNDAKEFFEKIITIKKKTIIQNPIDENMLAKPKTDKQRENIIASVGRLEPQKNQELLIRAFNKVIKEKKYNYKLKIYGEGSLRAYLQNLINELQIDKYVDLVGQIDEVTQTINNSKIFVLSSHYEGMPNALMEAMAMGIPCISTDCPCGGPRSLIKNGENGILVKNEDEYALSEAICRLIDDSALREKMAKNALKIREQNCLKVIVGEWYAFVNDVVGGVYV